MLKQIKRISLALLLSVSLASAVDFPITNGVLRTDLDAAGHSITNLGAGSLPYQPLDPDLTAIASVGVTNVGLTVVSSPDLATLQTYLEIGSGGGGDEPNNFTGSAGQYIYQYNSTTNNFAARIIDYSELANPPTPPVDKPSVANQFLNSFDSVTGVFTSGQPSFANISGTATDTQLPDLDGITMPDADVSFNAHKATDLAEPTNPQDAATKTYVDSAVSVGSAPHDPVNAASTGNLTLSGLQTIDGQLNPLRVLVKDQTSPEENGIYDMVAGAWTRSVDADTGAEIEGANVLVLSGTVNAGSQWGLATPGPITIDVTELDFVQTGLITAYTAGPGLQLIGSQFSAKTANVNKIVINAGGINIASGYVGQTSLTTLGTITTGVWNGTDILNANLEQMPGNTIKGNSSASPGDAADLTATATKTLLSLNNVENTALTTWAGSANITTVGPVTSGQWGATPISIAKGGTGATNRTAALTALLPLQTGEAGKVLKTDGTVAAWQSSSGGSGTLLNVKDFGATGDGVTNDYTAIMSAFTAANGSLIYFPVGTYLVGTGLNPVVPVNILGDNPESVIIKASTTLGNNSDVITLPGNSSITGLTIDANFQSHPAPIPKVSGIFVFGSNVKIDRTKVINCSGDGIHGDGVYSILITNNNVFNCALSNVRFSNGGVVITDNKFRLSGGRNVEVYQLVNSIISRNTIMQSGVLDSGIYSQDGDNLIVSDNIVTRCSGGLELWTSINRNAWSTGLQVLNNVISRNYHAGIFVGSSGATITGNNLSHNGQGGINNLTNTTEPGIRVNSANPGSGYAVGDILTLSGGTGTPAQVMVVRVYAGGSLYQNPGNDSALFPITMGNYSVWPTNPVTVTGGTGTLAQVIYTNNKISAGGTGYKVGDSMTGTSGTFTNPIRVKVSSVSGGGVVTEYDLIDGGGYSTTTATISFANDPGVTGSGFQVYASQGKRFSNNYDMTYGFGTNGPYHSNVITGNSISTTRNGPGILVFDGAPPYVGRMDNCVIVGNVLRNNLFSIRGRTSAGALDTTFPSGNIIANNVGYPP